MSGKSRPSVFNDVLWLSDGTAYLLLQSQRYGDQLAMVDAEDVPRLIATGRRWGLSARLVKGQTVFYVASAGRRIARRYLHQEVTGSNGDWDVDHIDGDRLNNTKANLRFVTAQENAFNVTVAKGFYWHTKNKKWIANIRVNGKGKNLGSFATQAEARDAYLEAKKRLHIIKDRGLT